MSVVERHGWEKKKKTSPALCQLTPVFSLMLEQSSEISVPLSVKSVTSVIPLMLLESSAVQSLKRLSCWYCRAGSWIAWMSRLESTSFPTLQNKNQSMGLKSNLVIIMMAEQLPLKMFFGPVFVLKCLSDYV